MTFRAVLHYNGNTPCFLTNPGHRGHGLPSPFSFAITSALQMSNKLPAKLFGWPRSDCLALKRQSVESAEHLVPDTKLKPA